MYGTQPLRYTGNLTSDPLVESSGFYFSKQETKDAAVCITLRPYQLVITFNFNKFALIITSLRYLSWQYTLNKGFVQQGFGPVKDFLIMSRLFLLLQLVPNKRFR